MSDLGPVEEPGVDRREWEAEMEALEPELRDSPAEALPELADLVGRELEGHGFPLDELSADPNGPIPEFQEARSVAERAVSGDEDISLGDVADAIQRLLAIHESLMEERGPL